MEDTAASSIQLSPSSQSVSLNDFSQAFKQPFSTSSWRWLILVPMNLLLVGYFAVYDSPQPLETMLKSALNLNDERYSYFYSLLAVPNIILPLIAGYIIDLVGVRPAMMTFAILVLLGHSILTFGSYILSFNTMIIGRVIFALGGDPLSVSQMVMINRWFKGKELAFALSFGTLIAGSGKALNSILSPIIYNSFNNLYAPFSFGALLCLISAVCAVLVVTIDKVDEKRVKDLHFSRQETNQKKERISLREIKRFSPMVWLIVLNFGLVDGLTFTLRSFLNDLYFSNYGFSNSEAGYLIAGHYLVMGIASPITGKLIDRFGYRASAIFFNSLLGVLGFLFLSFVTNLQGNLVSILPLILFGLYVAIDDVAAVSSLPLVLKEKYLGIGYGLFYTAVNSILFVMPYTCGYIKDQFTSSETGYFWATIFLCGISVLTVVESLIILVADWKKGRHLDLFKVLNIKKIADPIDEHSHYLELRL